ncbi:MAG: pyruvate dehydrogenase (acetyl-transferring) E1 component subunit alpha [Alphaproteobacteria bacterium]|nr:pyruvate dehydrogenase (acetyl-transferring) E1 component subunit alpha [Alphaproteobacteria bacterium]
MARAATKSKKSTSTKSGAGGGKAAAKTARTTKVKTKAKVQKPKESRSQLLGLYEDMLLIRRFEEKAGQLYGQGEIAGFCHLYIGQEAVVVGMQANLESKDSVLTSYRDHGHMLACGMDPKGVMAELTGRRGGYSRGKGGSMHMFSKEKNFYGGHGIVGAGVPIGAGLAFAHRYRDDGGISLTYYGDGAANQGQVFESFNMAALWKLPVIFIIENNQYGMGTSVSRASASPDFFRRGEPFGIPGRKVDGMDVLAVKEAGAEAVAYCRAGKGPQILQMETYRYRGHSMSDPARYRTREEVQKVREERDPIDHLSDLLFEHKLATGDDLKKIDERVKKVVTEAAEFAISDPEPDPAELYTDVLAEA